MGQLLDHDELISSLEAIKESSRLIINEYVSIIHYCNKCSEYYISKNSSYEEHNKNLELLKDILVNIEYYPNKMLHSIHSYEDEAEKTFIFDYASRSRNELAELLDLIDKEEYDRAFHLLYGLIKYKGLEPSRDLLDIISTSFACGNIDLSLKGCHELLSPLYDFYSKNMRYVLDLFNLSIHRCESNEMTINQVWFAYHFYSQIFSRSKDNGNLLTLCENSSVTLPNTAAFISVILLDPDINSDNLKGRIKEILERLKDIKDLPYEVFFRMGVFIEEISDPLF